MGGRWPQGRISLAQRAGTPHLPARPREQLLANLESATVERTERRVLGATGSRPEDFKECLTRPTAATIESMCGGQSHGRGLIVERRYEGGKRIGKSGVHNSSDRAYRRRANSR